MKIRQFTQRDLERIDETFGVFLVVESQPYGHDNDLMYNAVMSDETDKQFAEAELGRSITDKGRSIGFFQNFGGAGVFKAKHCVPYFSKSASDIIKTLPEGTISVEGQTWREIMQKARGLDQNFIDSLKLGEVSSITIKESGQNVQSKSKTKK